MSEKTGIAWTDSTWNPWTGCRRVSPGCKNCYMFTLLARWGRDAKDRRKAKDWKQVLAWDRKAAQRNTEYKNAHEGTLRDIFKPHTLPPHPPRPRIFPSLCDWLDDEVPIEWLADLLKLIHDTPNLDWLLLTKRPENWLDRISKAFEWIECEPPSSFERDNLEDWLNAWLAGNQKFFDRFDIASVPKNVWIGVSVEDQKRADERIPLLLQIPAKIRFLSVEPLLEKVNLHLFLCRHAAMTSPEQKFCNICEGPTDSRWGIVGGESGKDRRDCGVDALVDAANQFVAADVPCFFKQDSAFKPGQQGRIPAATWTLKQFPK